MSFRTVISSTLMLRFSAVVAMAETKLVMVEEDGCMWCARWNEEISATYPKTPEGRAAPLERIDMRGPRPEDVTLARPRIEGYPGEDFFWGLLNQMLNRAEIELPG